MREIKFRAWDKRDKIMFDPSSVSDRFVLDDLLTMFDYPEEARHIFQQYTGLKDKNGKEIYEGDIVECVYMRDENISYWIDKPPRFEMDWIDQVNAYGLIKNYRTHEIPQCFARDWEVIGNIYENPELLTPNTTSKGKR